MDERKDALEMTNEECQVKSPDYEELIIEMVHNIKSERLLKLIYGFVKSAYNEEKSRG